MISRFNDYSFLDDNAMKKIAEVVNDESKVVQITEDLDKAEMIRKQLALQGYNVRIEQCASNYQVIAKPREMVEFNEAVKSGQFEKVAFGRYVFKQANNPLGLQHYSYDEGTIWKVVTGKDGKEYLVKEVDDEDESKVIRDTSGIKDMFRTAGNNKDMVQMKKLGKAVYNLSTDELVDDLIKYMPKEFEHMVYAKLNNIIEEEIENMKYMSSPQYKAKVTKNIFAKIDDNKIFNQQQIRKLIIEDI